LTPLIYDFQTDDYIYTGSNDDEIGFLHTTSQNQGLTAFVGILKTDLISHLDGTNKKTSPIQLYVGENAENTLPLPTNSIKITDDAIFNKKKSFNISGG
jgi:hypothetical protein